MVKKDNMDTSYFQLQMKITPKKARLQDFLEEFDYILEYKSRRGNDVDDARCKNVELAAITTAHNEI